MFNNANYTALENSAFRNENFTNQLAGNFSDISSYINTSGFNYSIDLSSYNKSVDLSSYNKSVDLSGYIKTAVQNFSSVVVLGNLNVTSLNGTSLALFNRSIDLSSYNKSVMLNDYFLTASIAALFDNENFTTRYDLRADRFDNSNFSTQYENRAYWKLANFTTAYDNRADRFGNVNFSSRIDTYIGDFFDNANFSQQINNSVLSITRFNATFGNASNFTATRFTGKLDCGMIDGGSDGDFCADESGTSESSSAYFNNANYTTLENAAYQKANFSTQIDTYLAALFDNENFTTRYDLRTDRFGNSNFSTQYENRAYWKLANFTTAYDNRADRFGNANFSTRIDTYIGALFNNGNYSALNTTLWNRVGTNTILKNSGDNVGIGTSTPAKKLTINGTVNAITFDPSASPAPVMNTTSGNITISSNGGSVIIRLG